MGNPRVSLATTSMRTSSGTSGSTVSVPVFGALLAAVLKEVDFTRSHGSPPLEYRHNQGSLGESLPIYGPSSAAGEHEDGAADDTYWMNRLPQRPREKSDLTMPQKAARRKLASTPMVGANSATQS